MSSKPMFAGAVLSLAVLASCAGNSGSSEGADGNAPAGAAIEEGSLAPKFSLASADGAEVSLSGFRGTPVLLYFSMGPG